MQVCFICALLSICCIATLLCHASQELEVLALRVHHLLSSPAPIKGVLSRAQKPAARCSLMGFHCSQASIFGSLLRRVERIIALRCRSQTITEAVRISLSEVTPSSQEQQSVPVEAFLRELRSAVDSQQDSRTRAGEAVARLEQLPGAVLSGDADHAIVDAEAQWLMSVASSSTLPGAPLFTPVFLAVRAIGCRSTT